MLLHKITYKVIEDHPPRLKVILHFSYRHSATPHLYSCRFLSGIFPQLSWEDTKICLSTCFVHPARQCHCLSKAERPPSTTVRTEIIYQAVSRSTRA